MEFGYEEEGARTDNRPCKMSPRSFVPLDRLQTRIFYRFTSLAGHYEGDTYVPVFRASHRTDCTIVEEPCESRGGRPGLSVLTSLLVSVDVKIY